MPYRTFLQVARQCPSCGALVRRTRMMMDHEKDLMFPVVKKLDGECASGMADHMEGCR